MENRTHESDTGPGRALGERDLNAGPPRLDICSPCPASGCRGVGRVEEKDHQATRACVSGRRGGQSDVRGSAASLAPARAGCLGRQNACRHRRLRPRPWEQRLRRASKRQGLTLHKRLPCGSCWCLDDANGKPLEDHGAEHRGHPSVLSPTEVAQLLGVDLSDWYSRISASRENPALSRANPAKSQQTRGTPGKRALRILAGSAVSEGPPELGEGASGLWCEPTAKKHLRPRPP